MGLIPQGLGGIPHPFHMEYTLIPPISYPFHMDYIIIPHGLHMDSTWTPHGFHMDFK
jgi:hypothetical protein